ncbi:MAG: hypothetical protein IKG42_04000 [Clostridia bacterium]|nr:hypothetical protein [Clostridia bacterium]
MSKIKELLINNDSILVFDIDGVLALMEMGDYNHYKLTDSEWNEACEKGINYYDESVVCYKLVNFLKTRNMKNIYVITNVGSKNEGDFKKKFAKKYYNIPEENVYFVDQYSQKKEELKKIKSLYSEIEDYQIVMIDDTVEILNDIMKNTDFSTVHISSFLDI